MEASSDESSETTVGREEFWNLVCRFAAHFYILLLMVTVFLVMNLLVLLLVPVSSVSSDVLTGSVLIIALNFLILCGTAAGIVYVLRVCNRYTTPEARAED